MLKYEPYFNCFVEVGTDYKQEMYEYRNKLFKEFLKLKHKKTDCPTGLFVIPTTACNIRCSYCYVDKIDNNRTDFLTYENFKKQFNSIDTSKVKDAIIIGGEPFCNDDLFSIVEYLVKKGIYVCIVTNGVAFLNMDLRVKSIINNERVGFTLSFDANDGKNLRGISKSDSLIAFTNLAKFTNRLSIRTTLHKDSFKWFETRECLQSISGFDFEMTIGWGNFEGNFLNNDIYNYLDSAYEKELHNNSRCMIKPLKRFISNIFPFNLGDCDAGFGRIGITAIGTFICCKPYTITEFTLPEQCSNCDYLLGCGTQCWADFNSISVNESCCKFIKLSIEKAVKWHFLHNIIYR